MNYVKHKTIYENNINTNTTIMITALTKKTPIEFSNAGNYWELILLIYIIFVSSVMITCCLCSSYLRKSYGKIMKNKLEYMMTIKTPLSFIMSKEQIQPDIQSLSSNLHHLECGENFKIVKKNLGSLEYSIDYDFNKEELNVTIFQAISLDSKDLNGFSDPYIKVFLLPDKKKKFQTRMMKKTLNPVFNEIFTFKNVIFSEIKNKTVLFIVYDYDRFTRHDIIGELRIPLDSIDLTKTMREWKDIELPAEKSNNTFLGSICFSLRYAPTACKITVTILEAKCLKKMDIGRLSDPYVKIGLYKNGKRIEKRKTSIKFYTLNPYYNQSFTFDKIIDSELKEGILSLLITVIDYDRIGASEPIGKVTIGPNAYGTGLRHWNEMLEAPRRPIAYWHVLTDIDDDF